MKLKPSIYAKTLVELTKTDPKTAARRFWFYLQKNKQYKDLPKILDLIEKEEARQNNQISAEVFSENKLEDKDLSELETRLEKHFGKTVVLQNKIKKNIGGIIVKTEEEVLDLSLNDKIERLKRIMNRE